MEENHQILMRYLQIGKQKAEKQRPVSVGEFIDMQGDRYIKADILYENLIKEIEKKDNKTRQGYSKVFSLLKLRYKEDLADPFIKEDLKAYLNYMVAKIDTVIWQLDNTVSPSSVKKPKPTFDNLFTDSASKDKCVKLLQELKIINTENQFILPDTRKSGLMGFICALKEKSIIHYESDAVLYKCFTDFLRIKNTRIKSESDTFKRFYKLTIERLKTF